MVDEPSSRCDQAAQQQVRRRPGLPFEAHDCLASGPETVGGGRDNRRILADVDGPASDARPKRGWIA